MKNSRVAKEDSVTSIFLRFKPCQYQGLDNCIKNLQKPKHTKESTKSKQHKRYINSQNTARKTF